MKKRSKRYKKLKELAKVNKVNNFETAITQIKKMPNPKFAESIDVSFKVNIKKIKGSENTLKTVVELPNGNGKKIKVAVLCDESKQSEAKKSGAEIYGSEDLLKNISSGKIEFDKLVCTPNMMSKLGKLGKILGPKGLMPNPKLGTVTDDIVGTVNKIKNKFTEIKNDKDGNIGLSIGKKSFSDDKLIKNYNAVLEILEKEKSNNPVKGELIKSAYITSTMGVSYKVKLPKNI